MSVQRIGVLGILAGMLSMAPNTWASIPRCTDAAGLKQPSTMPETVSEPKEAGRHSRREAYLELAKLLADPLWTNPKPSLWRKDPDQVRAEMQVRIAALKSIQCDDRALAMAAEEAAAAGEAMIQEQGVLQSTSKNDALANVVVGGFAAFLGHPVVLVNAASGLFEAEKREHTERIKWAQAFGRSRSAQLMLPEIAPSYGGEPTKRPGMLGCDFDESFAGSLPCDAITLVNKSGQTLHHCLVCVEIRSTTGETRRNVHFVPEWDAGGKRYAQYGIGFETPGGVVGRQTVNGVQELGLSIWSDELSETNAIYQYVGPERDRDVEAILRAQLKFRWHYRRVPLLTDGPTVYLTLDGVPSLPGGTVTMHFYGPKAREKQYSHTWTFNNWNRGVEFGFDTHHAIKSDPVTIDVEIALEGMSYRHRMRFEPVRPD